MKVDHEEVRRIGRLAQLDIAETEVDSFARELSAIVTFVDTLASAPSAEQEDLRTPMHLRDDTPARSLSREVVAANAPAWRDGYFVVPRVIDRD